MDANFTKEERFKYTLLEYLSLEGENELQQMLSQSEIVFQYSSAYSNKQWNQRSVKIEIKVPVTYRKIIENKYTEKLYKFCGEIYEDDEDYGFTGIKLGVVLLSTIKVTNQQTRQESFLINHVNYQNLMDKVYRMDLEEIEKVYIYEACNSAISGNNIAAMILLGSATELLLLKLCNAYKNYLIKNGEDGQAIKFSQKVINAKNAYTRVDEFYKRVEANPQVFDKYGFENPKLQFNFLDIIRQFRNDHGHPTGIRISNEDLSTMFGNFQFLIEKVHHFINDNPGTNL